MSGTVINAFHTLSLKLMTTEKGELFIVSFTDEHSHSRDKFHAALTEQIFKFRYT